MKHKIIVACLAFCVLLSQSFTARSQERVETIIYKGHSTKFAFMVTNADLFRGVVATAAEMDIKKNKYAFEIVVVSKLAKEISENKDLIPEIDKAEKLGAKIVICEGALNYFKIDKSSLDKRLLFTPNGWIYMLELKDQGFNTLTP